MHYKCYKVNFERGDSYTHPPDWIKRKKPTRNPETEGDKFFR